MALRYAVASGNWADAVIWDGGTFPASGDDVYANGKIVNVNQSITVRSLHIDAGGAAVQGGRFEVSDNRTINLQELKVGAFTAGNSLRILQFKGGHFILNVATPITGDMGTSGSAAYAAQFSDFPSTITINADIQGGDKAGSTAVLLQCWASTITIYGNIRGGGVNGFNSQGLEVALDNSTVLISGTITGGDWGGNYGMRLDNDHGATTLVGNITPGIQEVGVWIHRGVLRVKGMLKWITAVAPVNGQPEGHLVFTSTTTVQAPSDSAWPAATGTPITLGGSGGGGGTDPSPPTVGQIWPRGTGTN